MYTVLIYYDVPTVEVLCMATLQVLDGNQNLTLSCAEILSRLPKIKQESSL